MGRAASKLNKWNRVAERVSATSYGKLARAIGLSTPAVSRLLRGQRTPTMDTARRLALALGVSLEELFDYIEAATARDGGRGGKPSVPVTSTRITSLRSVPSTLVSP